MALGSCGGSDDPGPAVAPPTPRENDAILLNRILDLELALGAAYDFGLPLLGGAAAREGQRVLEHERAHIRALARTVRQLGGVPKRPRTAEDYRSQFPAPRNERDMLRFAVDLENEVIKSYRDSIPRLRLAGSRRLAGSILASDAQHASTLLGLLHPGDPAAQAPEAFVTGVESVS